MTSALKAVFASAIWLAFSVPLQRATQLGVFHQKTIALQTEPRFKFKSGTNGKTADGAEFSTVTYESSDGIAISAITETYSTEVKAQRALRKRLKGASRILGRAPKLAGGRVYPRVVARFMREDSYRSPVMIFWIDGRELHSIGADSVQHAREFEKAFY